MTVCTLVVPSGSALAKFAGQKTKISTVLGIVMNYTVSVEEKKLKDREKGRRYQQKRKDEAAAARARYLAAARAAP